MRVERSFSHKHLALIVDYVLLSCRVRVYSESAHCDWLIVKYSLLEARVIPEI